GHAVHHDLGVVGVAHVVRVVHLDAGRDESVPDAVQPRVAAAHGEAVLATPHGQRLHAHAAHAHEVQARVGGVHLRQGGGRPRRLGLLCRHASSMTAHKIRRAAPAGVRRAAAAAAASLAAGSRSERQAPSKPETSLSSTTTPVPAAATALALCSWWSSAALGSGTITSGTPWYAASDSVPTPARVRARSAADHAAAASTNSWT